jgi:hypothetical protein
MRLNGLHTRSCSWVGAEFIHERFCRRRTPKSFSVPDSAARVWEMSLSISPSIERRSSPQELLQRTILLCLEKLSETMQLALELSATELPQPGALFTI